MKFKKITAILTLCTSLTMTACSFQFSANGREQVEDTVQNITVELGEDLSNIIDNADFSNEESLSEMTDGIREWAETYADESYFLEDFKKATLVRVVDGDTIVVDIDNEEYKVRLIGINTPESVASEEYLEKTGKENTKEGMDASAFVKDLLKNTETVYLESDMSDTDKYGRLLRYVWLEIPTDKDDLQEISKKMLNGILLWDKVAEVATYPPDVEYQEAFEAIEDYSEMEID